MEACRDLCLTAPYRCHSFDYGDTGERVCRLSHHTSTTLTQIQVRMAGAGRAPGGMYLLMQLHTYHTFVPESATTCGEFLENVSKLRSDA